MSTLMNNFEKKLVNCLRKQMSKREAEAAIYEIREGLGNDMYDQIRPEFIVGENGKITKDYPPIKKIIWAYFNDRWDVFEKAEEEEEETEVAEKPQQQQTPQQMTKKQRKAARLLEESRLCKVIPYMWSEFAIQIANHNLDNPTSPITDDFLMKVIKKGEEMDIWGADIDAATSLQTRNSTTNYNSLKALMGDKLFNEMLSCGVSWGYFAAIYDSIYHKKFGF